MVQIIRKSTGYNVRHNDQTTHFPGGEVIYENDAESFSGLILCKLKLAHADLDGKDLRGADFSGAELFASTMRNTQLGAAKFCATIMVGCVLTGSVLGDADFTRATMLYADFSDCDMSEACFEGAHLEMCFYNINTIWPSGINPESLRARRWDLWDPKEHEWQL